MLMIRLQRVGKKHDPSYRVVLTDSRNSTKSGRFVEVVGSYDARKGKPVLDAERIKYWLAHGAQATATCHNLLVGSKIITKKKINVFRMPAKAVTQVAESTAPAVSETK